MLSENLDAFSWNYKEMKGVHPSVCTHHIYIKETSSTTPKVNESYSQGYSQRRVSKDARCRIHLPYLRE